MIIDPILDSIDAILAWMGTSLGQTTDAYCDLESAENRHTLVTRDGSLLSVIQLFGCTELVGPDEFDRVHRGLSRALGSALSRAGHTFQFYFHYDQGGAKREISEVFAPARATAARLELDLKDL